ncbi:MAG: site-specific DNA-methyltransferase [Gammaproteobacteria bacterium]|nr:site-specific DNA-methyltransferase [Gammaproteobacteria bacterium]
MINKIAREDCFSFLDRLPGDFIDLAIIDPPYNMGKGDWDSFRTDNDFFRFTEQWIDGFLPKMKPTGSFYIFNNPYNSARILQMLVERGAVFRNWITWHKKDGISASRKRYVNNQETILFFTRGKEHYFDPDAVREPYQSTDRIKHAAKKGILKNGKRWYPNPKGRLCADVWEFSSHRHKTKINGKIVKPKHPTPKPEDMISRMVLASSKEKEIVLDMFSGTGTTALVCKKTGRNFVGFEKNPDYYTHLQRRLSHAHR